MRRTMMVVALLTLGTAVSYAQEVKKEVRKEVKVQEVNGEKVLTIQSTENGKTTEEIYRGAEAEKKMAELESAQGKETVRQEMKMEEVNGEKVLTVVTTENGQTKTEVFKGAEAEKRMKEIQGAEGSATTQPKPLQMKRIEVQKTEVKRKN